MSRGILLILLAALQVLAVSCSGQGDVIKEPDNNAKPVRVVEVREEERPVTLHYTGVVSPGLVKRYSFKVPGKISRIHVEESQEVKEGQLLALLDMEDLVRQKEGAEAGLQNARKAYDYAADLYGKMQQLYREGAVSKEDLDRCRLDMDLKEGELKRAQTAYEGIIQSMEGAGIRADMDGFVMEVLYEEGERVSAGYPVVVVRDKQQVIEVGIAERDVTSIKPGAEARIEAGSREYRGRVTTISQVPHEQTGTYTAEIMLEEGTLNIGAIVKVEIITGKERGYWIPVTSILSGDEDYVYVIKEDGAVRKKVTIEGIKGSHAKVRGIEQGDKLVVEGMKQLREGDRVVIKE